MDFPLILWARLGLSVDEEEEVEESCVEVEVGAPVGWIVVPVL